MHSFIFKQKLRRLNPALYLQEDRAMDRGGEHKATGIYMRRAKREEKKSDYNYAGDGAKWLEAKESGQMDEFICGSPTGWIPEWDEYDLESGRILAKGWRSIVLHLVAQKLCSMERARRIFSSSLGESDWDKASYDKKLATARKRAGWQSVQEQLAKYA